MSTNVVRRTERDQPADVCESAGGRGRNWAIRLQSRFWQIVAASVCLGGTPAAWAQTRSRNSRRDDAGGISLNLDDWLPETVMLIIAIAMAFSVMFYVVYPHLLRRSKPWWPLNAYGACLTGAFTLGCAAGLWIFWEDLILRPAQGNGPVGTFDTYALRGAVALGWFVLSAIFMSVFRSSRGRSAAR